MPSDARLQQPEPLTPEEIALLRPIMERYVWRLYSTETYDPLHQLPTTDIDAWLVQEVGSVLPLSRFQVWTSLMAEICGGESIKTTSSEGSRDGGGSEHSEERGGRETGDGTREESEEESREELGVEEEAQEVVEEDEGYQGDGEDEKNAQDDGNNGWMLPSMFDRFQLGL